MLQSKFQEKKRKKKDNVARHTRRAKAHSNKFGHTLLLAGYDMAENIEGRLRCPECRPTQNHTTNPDCRLCGGTGQTDLSTARDHILGEY